MLKVLLGVNGDCGEGQVENAENEREEKAPRVTNPKKEKKSNFKFQNRRHLSKKAKIFL
jgi:hypothetical protein